MIAVTRLLHNLLPFSFCSTSFQPIQPTSFCLALTFLLDVIFGYSCLLLSLGIQVWVTRQLLSFSLLTIKNWLTHLYCSTFIVFGSLSSSFIKVTIGDGVWQKYAENYSWAFSEENIQVLDVWWCNPQNLSAIQEKWGHSSGGFSGWCARWTSLVTRQDWEWHMPFLRLTACVCDVFM